MTYTTISVNPSTDPGAPDVGVDRVGGTDLQRVKISWGPENTANETDDTAGKRFPVAMNESKTTDCTPVQVAVDTSADQLVAANSSRRSVLFRNIGSIDVYIGKAAVTAGTGFLVRPGETFTDERTTQAWFGVTASSSTTVCVAEA